MKPAQFSTRPNHVTSVFLLSLYHRLRPARIELGGGGGKGGGVSADSVQ